MSFYSTPLWSSVSLTDCVTHSYISISLNYTMFLLCVHAHTFLTTSIHNTTRRYDMQPSGLWRPRWQIRSKNLDSVIKTDGSLILNLISAENNWRIWRVLVPLTISRKCCSIFLINISHKSWILHCSSFWWMLYRSWSHKIKEKTRIERM